MVRESRWKRGLVEGGIILASVLLAFWVDAWWERGQDRALEAAVLDAVAEEMEGNRRNLLSTLDQTDARLL